jgi:uncharacterized lipoprotein YddW (UPF0748 family)
LGDAKAVKTTRREFLEQTAAVAALRAAGPFTSTIAPRQSTRTLPRYWTWVHGDAKRTPGEWKQRFIEVRRAGIQGVLVSGGEQAMLSDAARGAGLACHRWIWTLNRSGDNDVKAAHPEWFTISRNGESSLTKPPYVGYYQWLCPTRPAVRDYLRGIVDDLAKSRDFDGVHLDYVRHCDVILAVGLWKKYNLVMDHEMPEYDFCYCDVCREAFHAKTGRDPKAMADPAADAEWRAFRWDSVSGLVRVLADAAHAREQVITAAVFPTPTIARTLVRQAWDTWPLDAVFPMLYQSFYNEPIEWIDPSVKEGVAALRSARPLYAGLYLPDLPPDDLAKAARTAIAAGATGLCTFEMNGLTAAHLTALSAVIQARGSTIVSTSNS